jgi:hypothetical protein
MCAVPDVTAATWRGAIREHVETTAHVVTDEY